MLVKRLKLHLRNLRLSVSSPQPKTYNIIILELAGGPYWIKHTEPDDGVHGEGHAVCRENLLGWSLKDLTRRFFQ